MAFQKTLTTVWNSVTIATNQADAEAFTRAIPRVFDICFIGKVTFATSAAEDITVNLYASNDGTTYTTDPIDTLVFDASNSESLILSKELREKVNDIPYIKLTVDNPDTTNTATILAKLSESII
jgi:hypothetical protein